MALISQLTLSNFRSFIDLTINLPPGVVVLYGDNAQGKTTLLEAIYLLAIARSFKAENEREVINFKIGETVVYPKHGVGEIINIESMEISSIKTNFYVVKMEQAKLTIRVPLDKQDEVGLRKISTKKIIDDFQGTIIYST